MKTAFFEPGITYVNAAPHAAPQHLAIAHRFHCVGVGPHPNTGVLHAIGWAETHPGVWVIGGISTEHLYAHLWTEAP